jgi:hypothetical protein
MAMEKCGVSVDKEILLRSDVLDIEGRTVESYHEEQRQVTSDEEAVNSGPWRAITTRAQ